MSKLAIIAAIDVAPGTRDQFLSSLQSHKARCLKDEPGTLQFEIFGNHDDQSKMLLYEVYRDDAAFEEHLNGPSIAQWRQETAELGAKAQVTRWMAME